MGAEWRWHGTNGLTRGRLVIPTQPSLTNPMALVQPAFMSTGLISFNLLISDTSKSLLQPHSFFLSTSHFFLKDKIGSSRVRTHSIISDKAAKACVLGVKLRTCFPSCPYRFFHGQNVDHRTWFNNRARIEFRTGNNFLLLEQKAGRKGQLLYTSFAMKLLCNEFQSVNSFDTVQRPIERFLERFLRLNGRESPSAILQTIIKWRDWALFGCFRLLFLSLEIPVPEKIDFHAFAKNSCW